MSHHRTLEQFSFECGIGLQAVYLNECGVYPTILPSIERRLVSYYDCIPSELSEAYIKYVEKKRYNFGKNHSPYKVPEPNIFKSPILSFREIFASSRIGFAKSICITPTILYKVEKKKVEIIPGQLIIALREILLPVGEIEEMQIQQQEFYYG